MAQKQFNGSNKTHVVHGPQGCGKTTNARRIADALQLNNIIDDWQPGDPEPITDHLILTNHDAGWNSTRRRVLTYDAAMQLVNGQ